MGLSTNPSSPARGLPLGGWTGGLAVPRMPTQGLALVALVGMVASTLAVGFTSDHLERPVAAAVYWSYLIAASMGVGLCWWRRRPASRFGPLLVLFAVTTWVVSWQAANPAVVFDLGVLAEGPWFVLAFYLFLSFPMGRLEPPAARWLMVVLVAAVVAFFLPWALFAPLIAGGGALTACGTDCPPNALQLGTAPDLVEQAGTAETYAALVVVLGVVIVYTWRLLTASRPQRRALVAVAVTSLLWLPLYFASTFAYQFLTLDPGTTDTLGWLIVAARVLMPLGFLVALLQADWFAAGALRTLLERLAGRPSTRAWRDTIATALDDDGLRLGLLDPVTGELREPGGRVLLPPPAGSGRAWVPIDRGDGQIAAMDVEETLAEDPELVRVAVTATLVAIENGALDDEVRASRERILEAGRVERRRIERDIHDSAQQRLVALRIRMTLASERLEGGEEHAMLERLAAEVDLAIDELRSAADGSIAALVGQQGVGPALRAAAAGAAIPVEIRDQGVRRHADALELAIYFCCLECLQNAVKHAGPGATVTITLGQDDSTVRFLVVDDGAGFEPDGVARGAGLTNLAERLAPLSGTLEIDARPGSGTRVSGRIPI